MTARVRVSTDMLDSGIDQAIITATKTGGDEMRRIIETSGTGWVGRWFSATAAGRVDTGRMLGDVSEKRTKRSGSWGWGLNGGKPDMYYIYQEKGFRHYITGKNVKPMHALLGSFIKAREQLIHDLDKLVK